ncbi:MAG: Hsp20/alpha crystallin family protein [Desulfobacterium sp.]|jgi:HSP20 family protein|nr:Hsp20/alpha crystallin family protein [Desulfobacterium sp.]
MFDLIPRRKRHGKDVVTFRNELDNLFNHFFEMDTPMHKFFGEEDWTPRVDLQEGTKEITVKADLPGCDSEDISATLDGRFLTIKGEKKQEKDEKKGDYHNVERSYGSFTRTLTLPAEVDPENIDASYKKGVLTLVLKKTKQEETGKKIKIKTD